MQIIIKNKNKFTRFIKENDKQKYNKDVKKYYYWMLEADTSNKLDGLTSFEISSHWINEELTENTVYSYLEAIFNSAYYGFDEIIKNIDNLTYEQFENIINEKCMF